MEKERKRGGKIRSPNTGNVQSSSKSFHSSNDAFDSQTQMFLFPKDGMPYIPLFPQRERRRKLVKKKGQEIERK